MKKKWVSYLVDGVLGLIVLFLAYCQISMMVSMNKAENYGVPSVFGHSLLYVVTDSMAADTSPTITEEVKAEEYRVTTTYTYQDAEGNTLTANRYNIGHIEAGEGTIIKREDPAQIRVGDIITFYYSSLSALDTHRVMEIDDPCPENGNEYVFHTRGDNLHSQFGDWGISYRDGAIKGSEVVGTVVSHSAALGNVLKFVSPAVPNGHAVWFVPLMVFIPLAGIATFTIVDSVKKSKAEERAEKKEIEAAMAAAGIDINDEAAVIRFTEKEAYKRELRKQKEAIKEKELARLKRRQKLGLKEKEAKPKRKETESPKPTSALTQEEKERLRAEIRAKLELERQAKEKEGKSNEEK